VGRAAARGRVGSYYALGRRRSRPSVLSIAPEKESWPNGLRRPMATRCPGPERGIGRPASPDQVTRPRCAPSGHPGAPAAGGGPSTRAWAVVRAPAEPSGPDHRAGLVHLSPTASLSCSAELDRPEVLAPYVGGPGHGRTTGRGTGQAQGRKRDGVARPWTLRDFRYRLPSTTAWAARIVADAEVQTRIWRSSPGEDRSPHYHWPAGPGNAPHRRFIAEPWGLRRAGLERRSTTDRLLNYGSAGGPSAGGGRPARAGPGRQRGPPPPVGGALRSGTPSSSAAFRGARPPPASFSNAITTGLHPACPRHGRRSGAAKLRAEPSLARKPEPDAPLPALRLAIVAAARRTGNRGLNLAIVHMASVGATWSLS